MRTFRTARKLAVPAVVGTLALVGAACEVEDEPEVVEQTEPADDGADVDVTEEETEVTTDTETETVEPTEGES